MIAAQWEPFIILCQVIGTALAAWGVGWLVFNGCLWLHDAWRAHRANQTMRVWRREVAREAAWRSVVEQGSRR